MVTCKKKNVQLYENVDKQKCLDNQKWIYFKLVNAILYIVKYISVPTNFNSILSGVIRNGGVEPNIIPDETELEFFLRAPSEAELEVLKKKVIDCINGAALCTGCQVDSCQSFI